MTKSLTTTNFNFPGQQEVYNGKVRDVYSLQDGLMVMVATDRLSAFDVVLPKGIPYKGQVLNQLATHFLDATSDIVPNWKLATPHPNVTIGHQCTPYKVEMVIRGYLAGHAWREYKAGKRLLCGVELPEGMKENDRFPEPIITPSTKAEQGHDEDISRDAILKQGIVPEEEYLLMEEYTRALFMRGSAMAQERGLILVDTKYEFGRKDDKVMLIDEIHTPDSSRYFYLDGYQDRQHNNEPQKQLSKEFVRQWLIQNGFQGKKGQSIPEMDDDFVQHVTSRYIELFEKVTGKAFEPSSVENIQSKTQDYLNQMV